MRITLPYGRCTSGRASFPIRSIEFNKKNIPATYSMLQVIDVLGTARYCTVSVGLGLTECCRDPDAAVTTIVYEPAGVPGLPIFALPPHAIWRSAPTTSKHANRKRTLFVRLPFSRLVLPTSKPNTGNKVA